MELVVFSLIVLMPMSMLLMNACLMPLNLLSPYIPLNNCVFVTRRCGHVLQSLMPWTFRLSTARHTLHVTRHKSSSTLCPAFFYAGPTQTFSLGAKKHIAVCVESTTYEIGARFLDAHRHFLHI